MRQQQVPQHYGLCPSFLHSSTLTFTRPCLAKCLSAVLSGLLSTSRFDVIEAVAAGLLSTPRGSWNAFDLIEGGAADLQNISSWDAWAFFLLQHTSLSQRRLKGASFSTVATF